MSHTRDANYISKIEAEIKFFKIMKNEPFSSSNKKLIGKLINAQYLYVQWTGVYSILRLTISVVSPYLRKFVNHRK